MFRCKWLQIMTSKDHGDLASCPIQHPNRRLRVIRKTTKNNSLAIGQSVRVRLMSGVIRQERSWTCAVVRDLIDSGRLVRAQCIEHNSLVVGRPAGQHNIRHLLTVAGEGDVFCRNATKELGKPTRLPVITRQFAPVRQADDKQLLAVRTWDRTPQRHGARSQLNRRCLRATKAGFSGQGDRAFLCAIGVAAPNHS